jgi:hypothetical protein
MKAIKPSFEITQVQRPEQLLNLDTERAHPRFSGRSLHQSRRRCELCQLGFSWALQSMRRLSCRGAKWGEKEQTIIEMLISGKVNHLLYSPIESAPPPEQAKWEVHPHPQS